MSTLPLECEDGEGTWLMVRDHNIPPRFRRTRWLLTIMVSFTAGVVAAATLFAYVSRIPIPIKVAPTRGADDLLSRQPERDIGDKLEFQQRLEERVINTNTPRVEPVRVPAAEPKLPLATEAASASQSQPQPVPAAAAPLAHFVRAGSFADAAKADDLKSSLIASGLAADVRSSSNGLFLVVVGPFDEVSAAEATRAQLALSGREAQIQRLPATKQ